MTWASSDHTVGQMPVASARKIGRRGPDVRRNVITSAACSVCTALPSRAIEVIITRTTAVFMNVRTGSLRPSLKTAKATPARATQARPTPSRMYQPRPSPNVSSDW